MTPSPTPTPTQTPTQTPTPTPTPVIQLIQANSPQSGITNASSVICPPSSWTDTAGNTLLAFVRMSTTTQTVSLADTEGNTYIKAVGQAQTTDGHQISLWYANNIAGGTNQITATFSAQNAHPWIACYEIRGLDPTNPLDQTNSAQGTNGTAFSAGNITTTQNNEYLFAGFGMVNNATGTFTAGSGWTVEQQQSTSLSRAANEDQVVTSTGTFTGNGTNSVATNWSALVASFSHQHIPTQTPTPTPSPTPTPAPTASPTPPAPTPTPAPAVALSVNTIHLVNVNNQQVFLHGVDIGGTAYGCTASGIGISDTPLTQATVNGLKNANVNAVRLALNEDCWLGINGEPVAGSGLTAATYRSGIVTFVGLLETSGIYPILDLHFSAPSTFAAVGTNAMADSDHSIAFWTDPTIGIVKTFAGDHAVTFDLYNEPKGATTNAVWLNGGTTQCTGNTNGTATVCPAGTNFTTPGMNALIAAIRQAENSGWNHVIDVEANISSIAGSNAWVATPPTDVAGCTIADFHNYDTSGLDCLTTACYNSTYLPLAQKVPTISGEIGDITAAGSCSSFTAAQIGSFLSWAESNDAGYLAWSWLAQGSSGNCTGPTLLSLTNPYTPTYNPYGQSYGSHILGLP